MPFTGGSNINAGGRVIPTSCSQSSCRLVVPIFLDAQQGCNDNRYPSTRQRADHTCFLYQVNFYRKGRKRRSRRFTPSNQPEALYRPPLSGKASLSDSSTVSQLLLFPLSNSTATAAAVNTPATPASMPPINAHLLLIIFSFSVGQTQRAGLTPPLPVNG